MLMRRQAVILRDHGWVTSTRDGDSCCESSKVERPVSPEGELR